MFSWKKKFNLSGSEKTADSKTENKQKPPKLTSNKSSDNANSIDEHRKKSIQPSSQTVVPVTSSAGISKNIETNTSSNSAKQDNTLANNEDAINNTYDNPNDISMAGLSINSSNNQNTSSPADPTSNAQQSGSSVIFKI